MNTTCCSTNAKAPNADVRTVRRPRYQIAGDAGSHTVRVELPGVAKEDVRLSLEDSVLTIRATRRAAVSGDWKALHRELSDAGYELRLRLDDHRVDEARLSANLEHGVLTLTLPVKEAAKPREIAVL